MKHVTIYTIRGCPFCIKAKKTLKKAGIRYTEHVYSFGTPEMDELIKRTKHETVPQIFFDDEFIGGSDALSAMAEQYDLKSLLEG